MCKSSQFLSQALPSMLYVGTRLHACERGLMAEEMMSQDCRDTAAAAEQREEIPICEREFANSLYNLVAALRRCSAAGIP